MEVLFKDLNILKETKEALALNNIETLTEIQQLAIPLMIEGKDFIAQAQTGTGKTFAFAVPTIEKIDINSKTTQSLVLCPTRELALQVYNEFIKLVKFNQKITVAPIVGGESYERQFRALKKNPHIIIGTPGRIIDHMEKNKIDFSNLHTLTFDEADEMLKMGFKDDIEKILSDTPQTRQTVLFSATIPFEINRIAKQYQKNAEIIKAEAKQLTVDSVSQNYFVVQKRDKTKLIKRLIDLELATSVIIFANTKKEVDEITDELINSNYHADSLHGDLKQNQRNSVTNSFRNKKLNILVATDVAARGLDISNVELVINYELPHENEVYVHRIGRTGRAGKTGKAYSIVTPRTEYKITELERFTKSKIGKMEVPSRKKIRNNRIDNFIEELELKMKNNEKTYNQIIEKFIDKGFTQEDIINVLIDDLMPKTSEYEEIEFVKEKKENKNPKERKNASNRKGQYINYKINVGRNDKATPLYILELLGNVFNIRNKNIGDIKHYPKHTNLEISTKAANIIGDSKKINYKGKNIIIEIL